MFLNFVINSFKFTSSIYENKIRSFTQQIIITLGDILLFVGMIIGIFQTREMVYLSTIIALLLCVSFAFILRNLSKIYKKLLYQITSTVLSTNPNCPNFIDKQLSQRAEIQLEQNLSVEFILILFAITFCLYCPCFYFITKSDITLDHPDMQVIPYFYHFWETKTWLQYFSKLFFEAVISFSSMGGYLTYTAFMVYTISNLKAHIKEINRLLKNAINYQIEKCMILRKLHTSQCTYDSYIFGKLSESAKQEFVKSTEKELINVIVYHQFIHSYIKDIITFLRKSFSLFFVWYISSTILFVFVLLQLNKDFIFMMKILSLVIHGVLALHVYCNAAQTIYQANELIMDSFYNTSWYYFSPKTRKNFLLTLTLCQRKYKLKCLGMYLVNLNLFLNSLRTVYSIINIIRATQKK